MSPGLRFRGTCRQTRDGGGLPEAEEGEEGGIPARITHDLVLLMRESPPTVGG